MIITLPRIFGPNGDLHSKANQSTPPLDYAPCFLLLLCASSR
jgi:hypothetical protein